jgi:hypothetical protein
VTGWGKHAGAPSKAFLLVALRALSPRWRDALPVELVCDGAVGGARGLMTASRSLTKPFRNPHCHRAHQGQEISGSKSLAGLF